MKKFEVISPFIDFDDRVVDIGDVIEVDEGREEALRRARVIGTQPLVDDSKKKTTKRSD